MNHFAFILFLVVGIFFWVNDKNKNKLGTINDLVFISCSTDLSAQVKGAQEAQKADLEFKKKSGRKGIAFESELQKENLEFMRTMCSQITAQRPKLRDHLASFRFDSDSKIDGVIELIVQRTLVSCPEKIKDPEAHRATLKTFVKYYMKTQY